VAYKSEPRKPDALNRSRGNFELDEAAMTRLKGIYQESLERAFTRGGAFALAHEPAPGVIRVVGHIVNLVVNTPPVQGREDDYVVEAGEMTLILDVRDSQTLEPLTRLVDRRAIRPGTTSVGGGYQSGPVTNWGAVRDLCENWARVLHDWLLVLQESRIPPAPDVAP